MQTPIPTKELLLRDGVSSPTQVQDLKISKRGRKVRLAVNEPLPEADVPEVTPAEEVVETKGKEKQKKKRGRPKKVESQPAAVAQDLADVASPDVVVAEPAEAQTESSVPKGRGPVETITSQEDSEDERQKVLLTEDKLRREQLRRKKQQLDLEKQRKQQEAELRRQQAEALKAAALALEEDQLEPVIEEDIVDQEYAAPLDYLAYVLDGAALGWIILRYIL